MFSVGDAHRSSSQPIGLAAAGHPAPAKYEIFVSVSALVVRPHVENVTLPVTPAVYVYQMSFLTEVVVVQAGVRP